MNFHTNKQWLKKYTPKPATKVHTSLIGGTKVPNAPRMKAYSTRWMSLAHGLAYAATWITDEAARNVLQEVQDRLFTMNASLA